MNTLEAIVLGLVQGLTEFLPISSSGHLRIVPALLGWEDPGAGFTAVIQLGTMAAVLIYFRADLLAHRPRLAERAADADPAGQPGGEARLVHPARHDPDRDLRLHLQGSDRVRRPQPLPDRLGADRLLLRDAAAERVGSHRRELTEMNGRDGLFIGAGPGARADPRRLALGGDDLGRPLPRLRPRRRRPLLVPALGPGGRPERALRAAQGRRRRQPARLAATAIATIVAFVTGYAAIAWLLRYLGTHTLGIFVVYRIAPRRSWSWR